MKKLKILLLWGFMLPTSLIMAQLQVTGKVTDEGNAPLPGVNILVLNSNTGTVTDANGLFTISAPANTTLVFSFVGYQSVERRVTASEEITIVLRKGDNSLSEVVITGYTSQTRRQAPGSISRIKADEVKLQPVGSFEQQLQGKAPGLLVQVGSGQPGASADVTIRGKTSILGSTQPLYIVDGIQISAGDFQGLNPSDFESINILKDAVATAQYGSRGANGVIVVTTRRGVNAKTKLTYDFQYGIGRLPENKLELMTSKEKIDFEMIADGYYGMNPNQWSQQEADSLSNVNADWANAMFRKNVTKQHVLSLSGGNDRTRFFISGSIFDQDGVVITTGLDRYTGRFNLDHNMGNFKLGLNGYVGSSTLQNTFEQTVFIGSPLNAIRWHLPYVTPYLPNGSYNEADLSIQGQPNALEELIENPAENKQLKGIASANLEYHAPFLRGLSARTNVGIDYTDDQNERYISRTTYLGTQQTGAQGSFIQSNARNTRYTITNSITYRQQSTDHNFGINLFNEFIKRKFNSFGFSGFGLTGAFKNAAGIIPGTPSNGFIPTVAGNETVNTILSYFAIADYSFRNKYILNATVRTDGASKLAEGKKWTTFGGIGASWIISGEDFMADNKILNDLRLKVSYGSAANSNVGDDYEALEQFSPTSYNGTGGLVLTNFRKENLTWERRTTFNAGIDFGLWKNKLFGTVEFYNAVTNDLYLNRQISGSNGATSILTNMGRLQNRGIEASISASIFKGTGFNWTISANHTYNQSKILELDGEDENINGLFINKVGERQNSLYVVRYIGVDPDNGEAIYLDKDGKETNVYDPNDRVLVGTVDPPHFGGLTNTFSYKGIELGVLFTYMFGHKIYNNDRTNVENNAYYYSNVAKSMGRAWMQQGDITDVPGLLTDFHAETTRFVEDAKTFRLRNVILSYVIPANISGKIRASSIRLFVQGQNLLTWHDTLTYDPEVPGGNLLGSQYPALKTVTAGLTIGF